MIVVVEPHADDAWLSLGAHIAEWVADGQTVRIVTVYGDPIRNAEAAAYAEWVGAEHLALARPEAGAGLAVGWSTELPPSTLSAAVSGAQRVIGPLGLQHPEHRAVAAILPPAAERYVELPYYRKQGNAPELRSLSAGRPVASMLPRPARANSPSSIFRSQAMFWRFNRESMVGAVEIILK